MKQGRLVYVSIYNIYLLFILVFIYLLLSLIFIDLLCVIVQFIYLLSFSNSYIVYLQLLPFEITSVCLIVISSYAYSYKLLSYITYF